MLSEKLMEALESIQNSVQLSMEEKLAFAFVDNHQYDCGCQGNDSYCTGGCSGDTNWASLTN